MNGGITKGAMDRSFWQFSQQLSFTQFRQHQDIGQRRTAMIARGNGSSG
jgi:hypothetical protein